MFMELVFKKKLKLNRKCHTNPIKAIIKPLTYAIKPGSRRVRVCISA